MLQYRDLILGWKCLNCKWSLGQGIVLIKNFNNSKNPETQPNRFFIKAYGLNKSFNNIFVTKHWFLFNVFQYRWCGKSNKVWIIFILNSNIFDNPYNTFKRDSMMNITHCMLILIKEWVYIMDFLIFKWIFILISYSFIILSNIFSTGCRYMISKNEGCCPYRVYNQFSSRNWKRRCHVTHPCIVRSGHKDCLSVISPTHNK